MNWRHESEVRFGSRGLQRRDFLRAAVGGAALASLGWTERVSLAAETLRRGGKRCVLLWMEGGPSQFETFDPKPGRSTGGGVEAIGTSVAGVKVAASLPQMAAQMGDVALVRSMTSREGSHPRAQYLMHHGYLPMGATQFPTLGANVTERLRSLGVATPAGALPGFVRIGGRGSSAGGGGLLGVEYNPLLVEDASRPPRNSRPTTAEKRFRRRVELLGRLESDFGAVEGSNLVQEHRKLVAAASDMILSPQMEAFDIAQEPSSVRAAYGEGKFADGCLLARRLLEAGVTFVEVNLGGWDTHLDNDSRVKDLCGQMDRPAAQLLRDLKERGMLDSTLVVWMGEFGRTPKVNALGGRDHYPKAFSAWVAGCGVRGGQVIGATDADGREVIERPVTPKDLHQTIYAALGIDSGYENQSAGGRPLKLVDEGAVIDGVLG
ncbi:MAG: DUF1501 domain-containing protein [Lacipirellulaceae bacterium]